MRGLDREQLTEVGGLRGLKCVIGERYCFVFDSFRYLEPVEVDAVLRWSTGRIFRRSRICMKQGERYCFVFDSFRYLEPVEADEILRWSTGRIFRRSRICMKQVWKR